MNIACQYKMNVHVPFPFSFHYTKRISIIICDLNTAHFFNKRAIWKALLLASRGGFPIHVPCYPLLAGWSSQHMKKVTEIIPTIVPLHMDGNALEICFKSAQCESIPSLTTRLSRFCLILPPLNLIINIKQLVYFVTQRGAHRTFAFSIMG